MPIRQHLIKDGHRLGFHSLAAVVVRFSAGEVFAVPRFNSWASEEDAAAGVPSVAWQGDPVLTPVPIDSLADAEAAIVAASADMQGGEYVAPLNGLDELAIAKVRKIAALNAEWMRRLDGGFDHAGHHWQSDEKSRGYIAGMAAGLANGLLLPDGFYWTSAANVDIPMNADDFKAIAFALTAHILTLQAMARQLKEQAAAAETVEELAGISWPAQIA